MKIIITILLTIIPYPICNQIHNTNIINPNKLIKNQLIEETYIYIKKISYLSELCAELLINECLYYGVSPLLALSQGQYESHFGTKGLAVKTNSLWNVLAFDDLKYEEISKHGKYNHVNESISPYLKLIKYDYLQNKSELELLNSFTNVNNKRYASDLEYEYKIKSIYNKLIKTTRISELWNKLTT